MPIFTQFNGREFRLITENRRHYIGLRTAKYFQSLKGHWAALISVSLALSQIPVFTLRDHGYGASASRGVPV